MSRLDRRRAACLRLRHRAPSTMTVVGSSEYEPVLCWRIASPRTAGMPCGRLLGRARADVDPDQRHRAEHEQDRDSGREHLRASHHPAGVSRPEAKLAGVATLGQAARENPHALEPVAEGRQHHRQERQRAEDADERDEQSAEAEPAEERHRQQQHQCEPDRDGEAAEDDRAAGVQHRLARPRPRARVRAGARRGSG